MINHTSEVSQHQFISIAKNAVDITNQKFNRLTVLGPIGRSKSRQIVWLCLCECGKFSTVQGDDLRRNHTKSCGCFNLEVCSSRQTTHNLSKTPIYETWCHIIGRCTLPSDKAWKNYGGRGISICKEWRENFQIFYDQVSCLENYGKKGYTLDRIDNEGNYAPENVRWATRKTQCRNTRRNRIITFNNESKCLSEWAENIGISPDALDRRYRAGWSVERMLTEPLNKKLG